jgi:Zn-dependent metalloprotease
MTYGRMTFPLLTTLLVAAPAWAQHRPLEARTLESLRSEQGERAAASKAHLLANREHFGLDQRHDFVLKNSRTDEFGLMHSFFRQTFNGVPVHGGEIITHQKADRTFAPHTSALKAHIDIDTTPTIPASEALAAAHADLAPRGKYATKPTTELVIFPIHQEVHARAGQDATAFEHQVQRYALAYHVHTDLQNGAAETKQMDYMIDANTGAILKKWSTLHTSAATGTGNSQYSGTVSLSTNSTSGGYELRDTLRGSTTVLDMGNSTTSSGTIYTNGSNTWGNGQNYYDNGTSGSTSGATGQTAAVDALYGFEMTWDYYKNVHGRSGIDGSGTATSLRVHYDTNYDNAYWDDTCFCMTFGDGSAPASGGFNNLTAIDVIGHELSHGVCANNGHGGLDYSNESGGLNEANSDINGTFVVFYGYNGGTGSTVPNSIPSANLHGYVPWQIGPQLSNPPLRYMYHPSLDGGSADYWYSGVGSLDVHYSSGPANRMMYFLAQGATTSGDTSTSVNTAGNGVSNPNFLPSGMTGIGNDHAARIWYRALTTYFTSTETYAQARTACMNAASDLYGTSSAEYAAVQNAFHGINVGAAATGVSVSISPTSTSMNTGASFQFSASVSGSSNTAVTWSVVESGGGSVSSTGLYTAPSTAGTYHVKVTSAADTTKSAQATVTVNQAAGVTVTISPATATVNTGGTQQFSASVSGTTNTAVTWSVVESGGGSVSSTGLYTAPSTAGTYHVKVTSAADTTKSAQATITVNGGSTGGSETVTNGGFESGATGWSGTTGDINTWSGEPAHAGTKDAWICGNGTTATESLSQSITIPSTATSATLTFWLHIDTAETTTSTAYDTFKVQVISGTTTTTLATYSNLNQNTGYVQKTFDLSAYKGKTVTLKFLGSEDSSLQTSFVLDDVSVKIQ